LSWTIPTGTRRTPSARSASRSSAETVLGYQRLADVVVLLSLPTVGCTLAASAAAGLADRKRPFSMLRLTGGSLAMLRRVVLLETAVPLLAVGITRHHRCHVPPPGPHYRARGSQKRMTPIRRARRCQAAEPAVGKFGSRPENRTSDRIGNQGQEQPGHHQLLGAAQGQLPNWDRARAPEVQCPEGPDHGPGFLLARRRTRGCDRGGGPSEPSWLPVSLQAHRQLRNDLFSELGDPRTAVPPIPEGAAQ